MLHGPSRLTTADPKDKIIENLLTPRGVRHFRMKLNTEEPPAGIGKGSDGEFPLWASTCHPLGIDVILSP